MEAENQSAEVQFHYELPQSGTRVTVVVEFPGGSKFTDRFDAGSRRSREKFIKSLADERDGLELDAIRTEIDNIAAEVVEHSQRETSDETQADMLVAIASEAELFHGQGGYEAEAFATLDVEGRSETWPVTQKGFRFWLARRFYERYAKVPGSQALQDALNVIIGTAIHNGETREVFVRIAAHGDRYYLDLCDADWRVVEIDKTGWKVIPSTACPVRFIRRRGSKSLCTPRKGGSIDALWSVVNLPDQESRVLYSSCLVAWLRPLGPYPILVVDGEQGSAKSTLCRFSIYLIDPKVAGLRRPPKNERDLMIAATNGHLLGYDNLSGLRADLSDCLCSLATGGGFATRELYSDGSEKLFDEVRPILMNGIDNVATRSDLLDRSVLLHLDTIPSNKRREDKEVRAEFEREQPMILGVLLDALSAGMAGVDTVDLSELPRMADFARFATAAEQSMGWAAGSFMAAYSGSRNDAHQAAIESSVIGVSLMAFIQGRGTWEGPAGELLAELCTELGDQPSRPRGWPTNARGMSEAVRRIAPNLRACGFEITFLPRTGSRRPLVFAAPSGDGRGGSGDGRVEDNRHSETGHGDPEKPDRDGRDGCDGCLPTQSEDDFSQREKGDADDGDEVAEWSA